MLFTAQVLEVHLTMVDTDNLEAAQAKVWQKLISNSQRVTQHLYDHSQELFVTRLIKGDQKSPLNLASEAIKKRSCEVASLA